MADVRVTCITKPNLLSAHEHITHIGNSGSGWKWTREQVIESIRAGTNTFYVLDPQTKRRAEVGVVEPSGGRSPFLQTYADGDWNNNLLSLPQCG